MLCSECRPFYSKICCGFVNLSAMLLIMVSIFVVYNNYCCCTVTNSIEVNYKMLSKYKGITLFSNYNQSYKWNIYFWAVLSSLNWSKNTINTQ